MINALLVLAVVCQDADVAVTGQGRRTGGEYELTVTGKGKALKDQETVSLRFRRVANRLNWEDGAIVTSPVGDESSCLATVEKNAFVHRERFPVAGDAEVHVGAARHVFRVSTGVEEAFAIGSGARRVDAALRGVRLMVGDLETMREEMCPALRKQSQVQKRIEWRRNAYRQEIADSFLTASAHALTLLMADLDAAQEMERSGKDATTLVSTLTGSPFSWDEVRSQIEAIEAASLRERALLIVRAAGATAREIALAVRANQAAAWTRHEREFTRTLEALKDIDQATRTGPHSDLYEPQIESLLAQVREYQQAGADCIRCIKSEDGEFAQFGQALTDRVGALEEKLRTRN
jgi:hypothetical protein